MYCEWLKEILALRRALFGTEESVSGNAIPFSCYRLFCDETEAVIGIRKDEPAVTKSGVPLVFSLDSPVGFVDTMVRIDMLMLASARKFIKHGMAPAEVMEFSDVLWMHDMSAGFLRNYKTSGLRKAIEEAVCDEEIMSAWRVVQTAVSHSHNTPEFDAAGEAANWTARLSVRMPSASAVVAKHITSISVPVQVRKLSAVS